MAYGWRIPFLVGILVAFGGLAIRRHYVERVPHQAPVQVSARRGVHRVTGGRWLHLIVLTAAISVGFYTTFVYSATWLERDRGRAGEHGARDQYRRDGAAAGESSRSPASPATGSGGGGC